jgi:hypothetical protein
MTSPTDDDELELGVMMRSSCTVSKACIRPRSLLDVKI